MKIQNGIVIHGILCALNADFYFDFYSRIVARFRWNLNSKWNRGKPIARWKSIEELGVNKRQKIGNLIFRSKSARERKRENLFIYFFSNLEKWKINREQNSRIDPKILHFVALLYLHSCLNVKYSVRWRHSWLPLRRNSVVGWHSLSAHRYNTHWNKQQRRETSFWIVKRISLRKKKKELIFIYITLRRNYAKFVSSRGWSGRVTNCSKYFRVGC